MSQRSETAANIENAPRNGYVVINRFRTVNLLLIVSFGELLPCFVEVLAVLPIHKPFCAP